MLTKPDIRTQHAMKRLALDADFQEILAWLEHSVNELDRANRVTMDGIALRMQQGAAASLAEFIGRVSGREPTAGAIVRAIPLGAERTSNTGMEGSARNT